MFHIVASAATAVSSREAKKGKKNKGKEFPPSGSNEAPSPVNFKKVPPPSMIAAPAPEPSPAAASTPAPKKRELEGAIPNHTAVEKKPRRRSKGEMPPPSDDQFDSIRLDGKITVLELVELISSRLKLGFLFSPIVSPFFLLHQMVLVELAPAHGLSKPVLLHAWENQSVGTLCLGVIQRGCCNEPFLSPVFEWQGHASQRCGTQKCIKCRSTCARTL
jgi:hypothetical protein